MKTKLAILCLLTCALCPLARAQSTAFTYQGRLNDGSGPASGIYDLRFTVYAASSGGSALAGPLTNAATSVSDGVFTATLDFGTGVFTGPDRWLEIGVRSNGLGDFIALAPRQALTPTPYAVYARGASAAGLTGTLPASSLFGTYTSPLTFNNGANSFSGSFYGQFFGTSFIGGSFTGDGSGLINLNASQITEGDFPASSLENAWRIIGNSNTSPANFIGTTDNQALEIRVNNVRGLRIEPDPRPGNTSANIIGGSPDNRIEFPGSGGSAIVGGGFPGGGNVIRSNASGVFIGGGSVNEAGPNANDVVIAGGFGNIVRTSGAVIGGGGGNQIQTNSDNATIGGGNGNVIHANSGYSAIAGGAQNEIQVGAGFSAIAGGWLNRIEVTADQSAIAGGNANQIHPGSRESFIGGGFANQIRSNAANSVIGGGAQNVVSNAGVATIGGGVGNANLGYAATIAGGFFNMVSNNGAMIGGGGNNVAGGFNSVVAGGNNNIATADNAVIGGGYQNTNGASFSTIGGGYRNRATGAYGTVPGGALNLAGGPQSFAAGTYANAIHVGAFVWSDASAADFPSLANNEFSVRAVGGVRFVTDGAGITLDGAPVLTAGSTNALTLNNPANAIVGTFNGDGAGLTNLNSASLLGTLADTQLSANVALRTGGNTFSGNQVITSGFVGINTNNPAAALHVGGVPGTDGIRYPDGTLQTTAPIPVFASGPGLNPTTTNQFMSAIVTVTVNSISQRILVTSHKAFGSTVAAGANGLNLYIGYRSVGSTASPALAGGGALGNRVAQNTRVTMGLSAVVSGLPPGNYEVGLAGNSPDAANWNSNEFSYTTATVY